MGGNRVDQMGAAAGGLVIALQALLTEMPRLRLLPQFAGYKTPHPSELTLLIQGFGAVGAHVARILKDVLPASRVTGVSDRLGYLYTEEGLPVEELLWLIAVISQQFFLNHIENDLPLNSLRRSSRDPPSSVSFSIAGYIYPRHIRRMTVDRAEMVSIITREPPFTRSAERPARPHAAHSTGRKVPDHFSTWYSGGVIYAAQEQLIKTHASTHSRQSLGSREVILVYQRRKCRLAGNAAVQRSGMMLSGAT
jgi:glutamate dehydrogenase (NAD(P)+)